MSCSPFIVFVYAMDAIHYMFCVSAVRQVHASAYVGALVGN